MNGGIMMEVGRTAKVEIVREAPFGFYVSDGKEDVLLHHTEISYPVQIGDTVEVFLYQDHQGRKAASLTIPKIQIGTFDWVKVVGVHKGLGIFVHIGIEKDILVSIDDLPSSFQFWPQVEDELYCSLKIMKERLFGELASEEQIQLLAKPVPKKVFNRTIKGTIYRISEIGAALISKEGYRGFIHQSEQGEPLRLGQTVEGRVIGIKEDGSVNLSTLPRNYERIDDDATRIFHYLMSRGGSMPYSDQSLPEDIQKRFNMSKGAFKRALGKLLKEGKIYQEDGWTYLKKQ